MNCYAQKQINEDENFFNHFALFLRQAETLQKPLQRTVLLFLKV